MVKFKFRKIVIFTKFAESFTSVMIIGIDIGISSNKEDCIRMFLTQVRDAVTEFQELFKKLNVFTSSW